MPRRLTNLPLTGRADELALLSAALIAADEGKGRLLGALAEQAVSCGFTVALGRAYPVESGVPYAVFSDALLPVLRSLEPSLLTLLTRGGTAELMQLFPALDGDRH